MDANPSSAIPPGGSGSWRAFINRPLLALALLALLALSLAYQRGMVADLSTPALELSGFYDLEGVRSGTPFRWTNGDARVWLGGVGQRPWHVTLTVASARPVDLDLPTLNLLA